MQITRFQLMHTTDAKLCSHLMFQNSSQNIERHDNYSTANENHNEIDVRSTFTIQSYVRIDRFSIDYQSVIDR